MLSLTAVRLCVLFATPLELYPDEAQYWVWSRHLAFGYFSKPPMIAWLIRATTALGGNGEAWVRLSSPLLHAGAAMALQRAGARLYGGWTGFAAALVYSLAPGFQLSSGVASTDAPMLLFVCLALWAYVGLFTARSRSEALRCAAGLGLSLGLGALAKYAALYVVVGLVLHALVSRQARRCWTPALLGLTAGLLLLTLAPNLAWNLQHGFVTVAHTASDADWAQSSSPAAQKGFDLRNAPGFLLSQFGVFGPVPLGVLIGGTTVLGLKRRLTREDTLLIAIGLPPLVIILAVAAITRANANWAGVTYVPASVLVAAWLLRWRARWALALALLSQALAGAVFMGAAVSPRFADQIGLANSFKRIRGWRAVTSAIESQANKAKRSGRLTAIATDDRFLFNAFSYYGRDYLAKPGAPPLAMWVRLSQPQNEAELSAPLTPALGARVLFASATPSYLAQAMADFRARVPDATVRVRLDAKHERRISLFIGLGFDPRPRPPVSGSPTRP